MTDTQLNSEIDRRTRELLALQRERMRRIRLVQAKTQQPKEQLNA